MATETGTRTDVGRVGAPNAPANPGTATVAPAPAEDDLDEDEDEDDAEPVDALDKFDQQLFDKRVAGLIDFDGDPVRQRGDDVRVGRDRDRVCCSSASARSTPAAACCTVG